MNTLTTLTKRFNTEVLAHLADAEVPILTAAQRQGDVMVVPSRAGDLSQFSSVPREGIAVVRGENGGNTHLLVAEGDVIYRAVTNSQTIGEIHVPEGATAWLTHPEHGFNGIGAGHYTVKRQREQADQIRLVAD